MDRPISPVVQFGIAPQSSADPLCIGNERSSATRRNMSGHTPSTLTTSIQIATKAANRIIAWLPAAIRRDIRTAARTNRDVS